MCSSFLATSRPLTVLSPEGHVAVLVVVVPPDLPVAKVDPGQPQVGVRTAADHCHTGEQLEDLRLGRRLLVVVVQEH